MRDVEEGTEGNRFANFSRCFLFFILIVNIVVLSYYFIFNSLSKLIAAGDIIYGRLPVIILHGYLQLFYFTLCSIVIYRFVTADI